MNGKTDHTNDFVRILASVVDRSAIEAGLILSPFSKFTAINRIYADYLAECTIRQQANQGPVDLNNLKITWE